MAKKNTRWIACRTALGREPKGWEFALWIRKRWQDFARAIKCPHLPGESESTDVILYLGDQAHRRFDHWLSGWVNRLLIERDKNRKAAGPQHRRRAS